MGMSSKNWLSRQRVAILYKSCDVGLNTRKYRANNCGVESCLKISSTLAEHILLGEERHLDIISYSIQETLTIHHPDIIDKRDIRISESLPDSLGVDFYFRKWFFCRRMTACDQKLYIGG
jgi:hypothetical protein